VSRRGREKILRWNTGVESIAEKKYKYENGYRDEEKEKG